MFNELFVPLMGLLMGLYGSFVGTTGGSAIAIYLLLILNVFPSQTMLTGTMMFVSSLPLGIFGLYEFYKHKQIDYYVGFLLTIGLCVGLFVGSHYAESVNKVLGEKYGDKIKFGITTFIYTILTALYAHKTFS